MKRRKKKLSKYGVTNYFITHRFRQMIKSCRHSLLSEYLSNNPFKIGFEHLYTTSNNIRPNGEETFNLYSGNYLLTWHQAPMGSDYQMTITLQNTGKKLGEHKSVLKFTGFTIQELFDECITGFIIQKDKPGYCTAHFRNELEMQGRLLKMSMKLGRIQDSFIDGESYCPIIFTSESRWEKITWYPSFASNNPHGFNGRITYFMDDWVRHFFYQPDSFYSDYVVKCRRAGEIDDYEGRDIDR